MKRVFAMFIMVACLLLLDSKMAYAKTIEMGEFKITAYCPCEKCSEGYGRKCAYKGRTAKSNHTIAVDPDVIGYGTKVKIGDTTYIAEDCGGGVKGDHIDIFFDTHEEVEEFGVKYKDVKLIR